MKTALKKIYFLFLFLGIDLRKIISLSYLPKYLKDRSNFKKAGGSISYLLPELTNYLDTAGEASGHYFHQDLLVASLIHEINPDRHIDVGSRIDGFVAHVASYREIEVIDIRELNTISHKNIKYLQKDITKDDPKLISCTDSLSCLHALEHFGLGRYGDTIDPKGHLVGFQNLIKMLKPGGHLYISFAIASISSVYFNAYRIFEPKEVLSWADEILLERFDYVDDAGDLHSFSDVYDVPDLKFGCGIYVFKKI